jgi:hypothetical protein
MKRLHIEARQEKDGRVRLDSRQRPIAVRYDIDPDTLDATRQELAEHSPLWVVEVLGEIEVDMSKYQ